MGPYGSAEEEEEEGEQTDRQATTLHFLLSSGKLQPDGADPIGRAGEGGVAMKTRPFTAPLLFKKTKNKNGKHSLNKV